MTCYVKIATLLKIRQYRHAGIDGTPVAITPERSAKQRRTITTWKALVAFALLGAVASPAAAVAPPGMRWMISHESGRIAAMPVNDDIATPDRFEGKVLAVDPQHGSFLLGTDAGMLALRADPQDLAELEIGQAIEVEMVDDESPDDLAALRSGA